MKKGLHIEEIVFYSIKIKMDCFRYTVEKGSICYGLNKYHCSEMNMILALLKMM